MESCVGQGLRMCRPVSSIASQSLTAKRSRRELNKQFVTTGAASASRPEEPEPEVPTSGGSGPWTLPRGPGGGAEGACPAEVELGR